MSLKLLSRRQASAVTTLEGLSINGGVPVLVRLANTVHIEPSREWATTELKAFEYKVSIIDWEAAVTQARFQ